jgi:predicted RNase H-like HicB family nuclease
MVASLRYYVISPNASLREFLKNYPNYRGGEYGIGLEFPVIYRSHEGGYSRESWSKEDQTAYQKLIFIADLKRRSQKSTNTYATVMREVVSSLLGEPPYHMEIFDRWWCLDEMWYGANFWEVLNWLSEEELNRIGKTGQEAVNRRLEGLKDMKSEEPKKGLDWYLSQPYEIRLQQDTDGSWGANIPLLDCYAKAATQMEVLAQIEKVKQSRLTEYFESKKPIPIAMIDKIWLLSFGDWESGTTALNGSE